MSFTKIVNEQSYQSIKIHKQDKKDYKHKKVNEQDRNVNEQVYKQES